MKIAIAIDDWKQEVFEKELSAAGYKHETGPGVTSNTRFIYVIVGCQDQLGALAKTVKHCQRKAAELKN